MFLLFGGVLLHRLPELEAEFGWNLHLENFGLHTSASLMALLLPGLTILLAQQLTKGLNPAIKSRRLLDLAYGYLPLVLGGNLAHYLRLGLTEAGQVLPVTFATIGFGTSNLPVAIAHPAVIAFLQATTLIISFWLSVILTQKIARQAFWNLMPHYFAMVGLGSLMWKVIVGY
jgi:hypothetical protein